MNKLRWLLLTAVVFLSGCGPSPAQVTILDGGATCRLTTRQRLPSGLLAECKILLGEADRLIYLSGLTRLDVALPPAAAYTLTVRRAVTLTVNGPDGMRIFRTSALTVGQALSEAGYTLYAADRFDPPVETPLTGDLVVAYQPSKELVVSRDGSEVTIRSAAATVGQALADAGLPLVGLDTSQPSADEALPADGRLRIIRVLELVSLRQKPIPFLTRSEPSADLEIDQQALLQDGQPGLSLARTRTVQEDGAVVASRSEGESIVQPPQDRILGFGTKIVIRTAVVDGVTIEYWRALTVYATYYKPCIDGTVPLVCLYYTSTRAEVKKGVVAMVYPWFLLFAHEHLYVPGYGFATVEDTNGANTSERWGTHWIDVGYAETDVHDWVNKYLTIYFLTPVAANYADTYLLP